MSVLHPVIWFADIDTDSESLGKQSKHLGKLTQAKFPLLPGFVITTKAYEDFLRENNLDHKIKQILSTISIERPDSLMQGATHIKNLFDRANLSDELINKLRNFYQQLGEGNVMLSLYTTDNHNRKHITRHTHNNRQLLAHVKDAWAAMFSDNALWHRHHHSLNHLQTGTEIIVQKKILGERRGTVTTIDPTTHANDTIVIMTTHPHAGDQYVVSKKSLLILDRSFKQHSHLPKLTHEHILTIAKTAKEIERHLYFPQEIMWEIEGDELFIIETKPISSLPQKKIEKKPKLALARGRGITATIGTGVVNIIHSAADLANSNVQDVLILSEINSKQLKHLKKVRGLIVESGSPHSEIATLLRHSGIPTIFQVKDATHKFHKGHVITVQGRKGEIYHGGMH